MIRSARFRNFKSLRDLACDLAPFTIVVGGNGTGKTSILDGLSYAAQSTRRRVAHILVAPFSPQNLWSRGATEPLRIELSGDVDQHKFRVALEIKMSPEDTELPGWDASVERTWDDRSEQAVDTPGDRSARDERSPEMRALGGAVGSALKLRLDAREIARPSYSETDTPRLQASGAGLPSLLADLALRKPDLFQEIQETARAVVPRLQRIRFESAKVRRVDMQVVRVGESPAVETPVERWMPGHQIVLDFIGAPDVPAPLASEGTLLSIALATALHMERRPRLFLLDDIDQALHPTAQRELVAQLRKILARDPELQIVATSHSPYFLDCFEPAEVLVTAARGDGSTACARLSDHPGIDRWRDVSRSGEIWSFVGEDWVAGQVSGAAP